MFLGALVDAGVSPCLLEDAVAALNIGAKLEISRVNRSGISATKVDVRGKDEEHGHGHRHDHHDEHRNRQGDEHSHQPAHDHQHEHAHAAMAVLSEHNFGGQSSGKRDSRTGMSAPHGHSDHRGLKEIREIIQAAAISIGAKKTAIAIFEALGAAEAKIHNMDIERVHFHEVGAVDAIVDIVCAAVGAEALGVHEFVCSPLNVGGGTVQCAHGNFPVPAPATLELLKDAPVYSSGVQSELVTPTGAAIVKTLSKRFVPFPAMKTEKIGYGAGTRDFSGHANVLRLVVGEAQGRAHEDAARETITVLEANIDDLNPQVVGYAMERALNEGALDAFVLPVQMKKNRPGMLLTVLCRNEDAERLTRMIFAETSTLGIRRREEERAVLTREWVAAATPWGSVRVKIARHNGAVVNYAAEYEDCRKIAMEKNVPLKSVMEAALRECPSGPECLTDLDKSRFLALSGRVATANGSE
ncbi:MAG: nickel pincer cofactor biosynthesis protein LarC [Terriglobales bacterium]